jgi:ribonuclease HI
MGVVVRYEDGNCVAALATVIPYITNPTTAEALAAWRAVLLCWDLGFTRFVLEGDSKNVVSAIHATFSCLRSYGHILDNIRNRLKDFPQAEVRYTSRNANQAAHLLAKSSLKFLIDCVWMKKTPSYVYSIVIAE